MAHADQTPAPTRGPLTAVIIAYASFVLVGASAGAAGVMLPAQITDYGVDKTTIGLTFFASSAGFMLAGATAGHLIARVGARIALSIGAGSFLLAGLFLASRPPFAALVAAQVLVGYGTGVLESILNVYLAGLDKATVRLNRLHAFFGVGALLGPLLTAWLLGFLSWTAVWLVLALAAGPLLAGYLLSYPRLGAERRQAERAPQPADAQPADAQPAGTQPADAQPAGTPLAYATPADTPLAAATPVNTPLAAATPVNTPLAAATPVNTPLAAATPVNTPLAAVTPLNTPFAVATPLNSPAANSPSINPPLINPPPANPPPATGSSADAPTRSNPARGLLGAVLREPAVMLGTAFLAVYVGLEIGVGTWAYSFLVEGRGVGGVVAGYAVSGYWLGLTLGRFLISPAATRIALSPAATSFVCLAGVAAAAALAWAAPVAVVAGAALVLMGFFLGPLFPTAMAMVPRLTVARLVPTAIGVMNAGSVVGGSVFPWLAGAVAQGVGVWTLMPFALALALFQAALWRYTVRRERPA